MTIPPTDSPLPWSRRVWRSATIVLNAIVAGALAWHGGVLDHAVEASLLNLCVAIAARHDGVVRAAFAVARAGRSYRLQVLANHVGQLHRSAATAATAWLAVALAAAAAGGDVAGPVIGMVVVAILLAMAWTARDRARHDRHERFERVHRYGGWAALAIIAALVARQALQSAPPDAGLAALLAQPASLLLLAVVALVAHPWLSVRRVPVEILDVTAHVVVVALPGRRSRGAFVRVSREGREWHAFAVATTGLEGPGRCSLVIRRAGDWTERLARDAERGEAPRRLYVRRLRGRGFMGHAQAYHRVLVVATGAGIGPVLPYLVRGDRPRHFTAPSRLECLWIGRDHRAAMGAELVDRVLAGGDVTLVDSAGGRPDVAAQVEERARRCEAVFVVANAQVRDVVARVCERLGVPWHGPTFDS